MRIRLRDVARRAGVSEATVSRVINGKPGVAAHTRSTVFEVLAELGYVPPGSSGTVGMGLIGLVVPELDNPVFPVFAESIEARLLSQGYVSILCCAGRVGANEDAYVPALLEQRVAGIVFVSGRHAMVDADHAMYRTLLERGLPLVFVNGAAADLAVPSVSTDEAAAATMAVEHLARLGHQRIGLLSGSFSYVSAVRRHAGYRESVERFGRDVDDDLVSTSMFTVEGGHAGAQQLVAAGATAIVAANDLMALGAIRAARETGRRVPADISVVGFDDTELISYTDPPLTTIRQQIDVISDHAVGALMARIGGRSLDASEFLVRPELVVRGSTGRCELAR